MLDPLSPEGSGRYVARAFDHQIDASVDCEVLHASPTAALIVDGIFLLRPELRAYWDLSIFLHVDFAVSVPRGARRGPGSGSAELDEPSNRRYVDGQKRYFAECAPAQRADIVIDSNDLRVPRTLKWNDPRS